MNSFLILLEEDTFKTGSDNGKLAYSFPGIHDMVTITNDALKGLNNLSFELDIENGLGDVVGCKDTWKCKVKFDWNYTPEWYYVSP